MGCVSSKILAKSGSFQEKVMSSSLAGHNFQRSSAIEDIILSTSKTNGDQQQFLALLRTSASSACRKAKEPAEAHRHSPTAPAEPTAKIETINVPELLAGLEEEGCTATAEQAPERRQSSRDDEGDSSQAPWSASAGKARSFRTVEEFDAMVLTQQQQMQGESGSSSERRATALATGKEELATATPSSSAAAEAATAGAEEGVGQAAAAGAKRRARARQLGELNVPMATAFDFSKSGSLRDWLRHGGQIFSPGSYVTPRFGTPPKAERGGAAAAGEEPQRQATFDPELVAQFERAMEQLSEDEGRVLDEILEALQLEAAEKDGAVGVVGKVGDDQPAAEPVLVRQVV